MVGFGERLRELRGLKSQSMFAKELGLSQVVYGRYELNQREPNLETLCHIGLTLGVSADWLLGLPERGGSSPDRAPAGASSGDGRAALGLSPAPDCSKCQLLQAHIREITGRK